MSKDRQIFHRAVYLQQSLSDTYQSWLATAYSLHPPAPPFCSIVNNLTIRLTSLLGIINDLAIRGVRLASERQLMDTENDSPIVV
jgi:hypothetical protein